VLCWVVEVIRRPAVSWTGRPISSAGPGCEMMASVVFFSALDCAGVLGTLRRAASSLAPMS
jgi:hypothetical protein